LVEISGTGSKYIVICIESMKKIVTYSEEKTRVIMLFLITVPRMCILAIFFFEVFSGYLHYYFFSLYLLFIPAILNLVLFLLSDVRERIYPQANSMVIPQSIPENINGKIYIRFSYTMADDFKDINTKFFVENYYLPLLYFEAHHMLLKEQFTRINLITTLFYFLCHIIGFMYILTNF
jgi:hypothetical protein